MSARKPLAKRLDDPDAEAVRRSHAELIEQLQAQPANAIRTIDVTIPNNTLVIVSHGLGRRPRAVLFSPPRIPFGVSPTVGMIIDSTGGGIDRSQSLRIGAFSWGTSVDITVTVF